MITSYPLKGKLHGNKTVGIASYAKNTILSLKSMFKDVQITVLAERFENKNESYKEKGILIERIWKRNSLLTFINLIKYVLTNFKDGKKVLIEFEVSMFGSILYLIPFLFFLFFLKILKKDVILVMHQVIPDINEMYGHLNMEPHTFLTKLVNIFVHIYYVLIQRIVGKTIVFEEILKNRLRRISRKKNIVVIPHGIESFNLGLSQKQARKKLKIPANKFIILSFGFIAWYKGTDVILNMFRESFSKDDRNKNHMLIIAGGPNPNHLDKDFYVNYVNKIEKESKNNILVTGFVPEEKIPLYFQAADVVVLPYRTLMSSSGPLSLAFSFKKPVLLSQNIKAIFETKDISALLSSFKVKKGNLLFKNKGDFKQKINKIIKDVKLKKKLALFAKELSKVRSWNNLSKLYYEEIFT